MEWSQAIADNPLLRQSFNDHIEELIRGFHMRMEQGEWEQVLEWRGAIRALRLLRLHVEGLEDDYGEQRPFR